MPHKDAQSPKTYDLEAISSLIAQGDNGALIEALSALHPSEAGRLLADLGEDDATTLFKLLSPEKASEVILEVDERLRKKLIASITPDELIEVVEEMETDDAADVISELPAEEARHVLDGIAKEESIEVQKLLIYPEDSAGGKMQAELASVRVDATVEQTIEEVRKKSKLIENISSVFVVDVDSRLVGAVPLHKLILASPETRIIDIADKNPMRADAYMDQEQVSRLFQKYDLVSMPVVDAGGRLIGRITVDDVVDIIEEEIFEDFYKMAGLNTEARVLDPPMRSIRMRIPWLLVNLATAFLAASVVKAFEGTIEELVVLAVLMPIVAGMGGNAATQTITVVVRGIAIGELPPEKAKKLLAKEALVGLANGIATGALAGVIAYILGGSVMVGLLLFLAMTCNLVIAGLSGALIPLILKWRRIDPAISSSIFVTTCTDIGGFFTFLGLATIFMKAGLL